MRLLPKPDIIVPHLSKRSLLSVHSKSHGGGWQEGVKEGQRSKSSPSVIVSYKKWIKVMRQDVVHLQSEREDD